MMQIYNYSWIMAESYPLKSTQTQISSSSYTLNQMVLRQSEREPLCKDGVLPPQIY